jgi:predicted nucleotidyltransferase
MEAILLKEGKQNALIVKTKNGTFLIDTTPHINEKLQEEEIDEINCFILTKKPSGINNLTKWLSKKEITNLMALMPLEIANNLREEDHNLDLGYFDIMYYQPGVTMRFDEGDIKVTPFKEGIKLLDIAFLHDKPEDPKLLEQSKVIISNNCEWFLKGDNRLTSELQEYSKINPEEVIISGTEFPENAEQSLKQYWREIQGGDTTFRVATGNIRLKMREHISQVLHSLNEGIILPDAEELYTGFKKAIVRSKMYNSKIDKFLYLMDRDFCYGILKLKRPDKINLEEFKLLETKHKINEDERQKWWPYKEILYCYNFELAERYDVPKKIDLKDNSNTFTDKWDFVKQDLIEEDIKKFDPEKKSTQVLKDDWRIVNAWYSSKRRGVDVKHSLEDIINLAKMIYLELKKRGIEFHPESMKEYSKELYNKVSGKSTLKNKDLSDPELLKEFTDKRVIKDFISVVGSYAEGKQNPNDIDILIRLKEPTDYIKRAIEVRILKDLSFCENVHFIWGDPEGPHDTYIPLYDLKLERIKPLKIIKMMTESVEMDQISPFYPMKPAKRFYEIDEAIKYMFEKGNKYSIEKKFNGYRGVLIKRGKSAKLYSDQKKDISRHFDTILSEAQNVANGDFVIDAEIVYGEGGRAEIAKYVTGDSELDDSKIKLHVFDVIYYKEDLTSEPWYERKGILHSFNFTDHIKEVNSIIVDTPEEAKKAIKFNSSLSGSEGALIKQYKGKYKKGGETDAWIKYRKTDMIVAKVLSVNKKERDQTYTIGIKAFDKANKDHVKEDFLELGDTFITDVKAEKGDNLKVNIEEVWKHSYKDNTIRFSIHKPKVLEKTSKPLTDWKELDNLAVSKGEEVIENEDTSGATTTGTSGISDNQGKKWKKKIIEGPKKLEEELKEDEEGGEEMVKNFPERMQRNFEKVKGWRDFVIQWHLRGKKSIHTDLRMDVGESLEGFTLFSPSSMDKEDELTENPKNIRGTIKLPQPKEWLKVSGGYPAGSPGATSESSSYFAIIAKGKYRPLVMEDHKLVFELKSESGDVKEVKPIKEEDKDQVAEFNKKLPDKLKDLNGCFSYHIAHIGDRHIILFDKLKECPKIKEE